MVMAEVTRKHREITWGFDLSPAQQRQLAQKIADIEAAASVTRVEQDERERAHLLEGARLLEAFADGRDSYELKDALDCWLEAERVRLSAAIEPKETP